MQVQFVGQPFADADQIGELIAAALRDPGHDHAWFVTAWGKQSGLSRLAQDLDDLRTRGGHAEVIVGVDEGGATKEGLRLAVGLFDAAYVFHDPGARTFHPKIYVVQGATAALAIVGSGNLTRGGLFTNYEGSIAAELDLSEPGDALFLKSVRDYFDRLTGFSDHCKLLDGPSLLAIEADPTVQIVSEKQANKNRAKRRGTVGSASVFGSAITGLADAPPPGIPGLVLDDDDDDDDSTMDAAGSQASPPAPPLPAPPPPAPPPPAPPPPPSAVERWWKRLTASDAHRKPQTSHQRNYVVLGQAGHNIDRNTWFRTVLFGGATWQQQTMHTGNVKEVADIPFDVFVNGSPRGQYDIRVDHSTGRIANQNNAPTYLNWSNLLGEIKQNDYEDWYLELSLRSDGSYRLDLSSAEPS